MTIDPGLRRDDVAAALDADRLAAEKAALDLLAELTLINETLSPLEARKKKVTEALKQYMALEGVDELRGVDHRERPVTARMQERRGTPVYDLVSAIAAGSTGAVLSAGSAGMLRLDHQMFDRFMQKNGAGWGLDLARYRMDGPGTVALVVEHGK